MAGLSSLALFSGETMAIAKITGTVVKKQASGTTTIIEKVGTGGLALVSHPATSQLAATNSYRYIGKNPNNYVNFNNELWRIIGVFEVDDGKGKLEKRIKLIREDNIGSVVWDVNNVNDWSQATGMTLLNSGDYWNRTGSYASTGLTTGAKTMIGNAKWYLGAVRSYDSDAAGLTSHFYEYERGTQAYYGVLHATSWVGKVGLIYSSDYGYAAGGGSSYPFRSDCLARALYAWDGVNNCYANNWLYNFLFTKYTITPYIDYNGQSETTVFYTYRGVGHNDANSSGYFQPCVYLLPDVKITGGTGTETDPYTLSK